MEYNPLKNKRNDTKSYLLVFLGLIIIVPIVWILIDRMEGNKPQLDFALQSNFIGKSLNLPVTLTDHFFIIDFNSDAHIASSDNLIEVH